MVKIVPYEPEHAFMIDVQESQMNRIKDFMGMAEAKMLAEHEAYSAFVGDECIGCSGIIDCGMGRGQAWAILGRYSGKQFVAVIRAIERMLDVSGYRRVEMACDVDFAPAHRLAMLLGFMPEARMSQYFAVDKDAILYTRLNNG